MSLGEDSTTTRHDTEPDGLKGNKVAIDYNKLATADFKDRPPFHDMNGDYIVVIQKDEVRDDRETPDVNYCIWKILKVLHGDPGVIGRTFSRRRPIRRDGTAEEMQNRYCTALSMKRRLQKVDRDPTYEFPRAKYTGMTIQAIHDCGGSNIAGYPIRVSSKQTPMKKKEGVFTVCTYHFPSEAELEGIALNDDGQVVGA